MMSHRRVLRQPFFIVANSDAPCLRGLLAYISNADLTNLCILYALYSVQLNYQKYENLTIQLFFFFLNVKSI